MKIKNITKMISTIAVSFLLVAAGSTVYASTFNGGSKAGVTLKVKDTGTTDTSSTTDSSSSTDSSSGTDTSSGTGGSGGSIGGGGTASGSGGGTSVTVPSGKTPVFPQTGEIVRGGASIIGVALIGAVLFFFWKKRKAEEK